jgi:glycosyltransferase involved in cell wall biosynthesis
VEGLPNAVCESMLCGCIPVCSEVGGSRTAVGGDGFVVPPGDGTLLAGAIMKAMALPASRGIAGRESIAGRFTMARREEGLVRAVNEVMA